MLPLGVRGKRRCPLWGQGKRVLPLMGSGENRPFGGLGTGIAPCEGQGTVSHVGGGVGS